jgi:taurine dioxygenase
MELVHLSPHIGTEVRGVDIAQGVADADFAAMREAWLNRSLLLFRGQTLTPDQLVDFSRRFGELEQPPASERATRTGAGMSGRPEVWLISNVKEKGVAIGSLGDGEAEWHTDMSYIDEPPTASILYSREIPASGGNTSFASMYAALAEMPAGLKERIAGRIAKHDSSYTSAGMLRQGMAEVTDVRQAPGAVHPIARTVPETGRQALYLGRRTNGYVMDLPVDESEALLDELWAWCTGRAFVYEHVWQVGDLLVWDNRSAIHRRDAFDPASRRIMLRTQVKGERPRG